MKKAVNIKTMLKNFNVKHNKVFKVDNLICSDYFFINSDIINIALPIPLEHGDCFNFNEKLKPFYKISENYISTVNNFVKNIIPELSEADRVEKLNSVIMYDEKSYGKHEIDIVDKTIEVLNFSKEKIIIPKSYLDVCHNLQEFSNGIYCSNTIIKAIPEAKIFYSKEKMIFAFNKNHEFLYVVMSSRNQ
jgi:hypothetical protein